MPKTVLICESNSSIPYADWCIWEEGCNNSPILSAEACNAKRNLPFAGNGTISIDSVTSGLVQITRKPNDPAKYCVLSNIVNSPTWCTAKDMFDDAVPHCSAKLSKSCCSTMISSDGSSGPPCPPPGDLNIAMTKVFSLAIADLVLPPTPTPIPPPAPPTPMPTPTYTHTWSTPT